MHAAATEPNDEREPESQPEISMREEKEDDSLLTKLEQRQQGYSDSRPLVSRWAAQMRKQEPMLSADAQVHVKPKRQVKRAWSARYAVWLLFSQPETLSDEKKAALERMLSVSPTIRRVYNFAQAFTRIVRDRYAKSMEPWLTAVIESRIPELNGFARSLSRDKDAVLAALSLPWSNGQVEGQVNRVVGHYL